MVAVVVSIRLQGAELLDPVSIFRIVQQYKGQENASTVQPATSFWNSSRSRLTTSTKSRASNRFFFRNAAH